MYYLYYRESLTVLVNSQNTLNYESLHAYLKFPYELIYWSEVVNGSLLLSINYCMIKVYAYVFRIIFLCSLHLLSVDFIFPSVYIPIRAIWLLIRFSSCYYYDHNSFHFSFNSTFLYSFCQVCSFNPVYCNRDLTLVLFLISGIDFSLLCYPFKLNFN